LLLTLNAFLYYNCANITYVTNNYDYYQSVVNNTTERKTR